MTQFCARDIVQALKRDGFVEDHVRGDHHIFKNAKTGQTVPVAYSHLKDDIPVGTAKSILKIIDD